MNEDRTEKELSEVNVSYVRVLDEQGNSGKATIEAIASLMGLDSYIFDIASNNASSVNVRPGVYLAWTSINPEIVVFCIGGAGRPDYGIHVLLGSTSGAFSFSGAGSYVNITLSKDGNSIKISNKYAATLTVKMKRLVL